MFIVVGDVDDPRTAQLHQLAVAINDQADAVSVTWLADGDVARRFRDLSAFFALKLDDPETLD